LIDVSAFEIRSLPLVSDVDDLGNVPQEAKWLVGWWLDPTTYKPAKRASVRWHHAQALREGNHPRWYWGAERRGLIARLVERIKHWKIVEGGYESSPNIEATWFVDPPYQVKGSTYVHGSKDIDYEQLGGWCRERAGQVVVCENIGADWLPFRRLGKETVRKAVKGKLQRNSEVFWTNSL
jgi:hypothetical protein